MEKSTGLTPLEEEVFCIEGQLKKQGKIRKNWKTRHFEIERKLHSGVTISYYETNQKLKKKGQFDLNLQTFRSCVRSEPIEGYENIFKLKVRLIKEEREFILSAPNALQQRKWIESILFWGKGQIPNKENNPELEIERAKGRAKFRLKGERIEISGWLLKKGVINKKPQQRYFVLANARLTDQIPYFEDEAKTKKKGEIPLKRAKISQKELDILINTTQNSENSTSRIFELRAKNKEEAAKWTKAISLAIHSLEEEQVLQDLYLG